MGMHPATAEHMCSLGIRSLPFRASAQRRKFRSNEFRSTVRRVLLRRGCAPPISALARPQARKCHRGASAAANVTRLARRSRTLTSNEKPNSNALRWIDGDGHTHVARRRPLCLSPSFACGRTRAAISCSERAHTDTAPLTLARAAHTDVTFSTQNTVRSHVWLCALLFVYCTSIGHY